ERLDLVLRAVDHQVHVEPAAGAVHVVAQRLDHLRTHRDRRNEVPVHHVAMDHARARVHHGLHLLPHPRPVGREYRRRYATALGEPLAHPYTRDAARLAWVRISDRIRSRRGSVSRSTWIIAPATAGCTFA